TFVVVEDRRLGSPRPGPRAIASLEAEPADRLQRVGQTFRDESIARLVDPKGPRRTRAFVVALPVAGEVEQDRAAWVRTADPLAPGRVAHSGEHLEFEACRAIPQGRRLAIPIEGRVQVLRPALAALVEAAQPRQRLAVAQSDGAVEPRLDLREVYGWVVKVVIGYVACGLAVAVFAGAAEPLQCFGNVAWDAAAIPVAEADRVHGGGIAAIGSLAPPLQRHSRILGDTDAFEV